MRDSRIGSLLASGLFASMVFAATCVSAQEKSVVFTGVDGTENGWGSYLGYVSALNGDLGTSGWTTTVSLGYSQYSDDSTTPTVNTDTVTAAVLLGYVWAQPDYYLTLNLGVDLVDNAESPSTGSRTEGRKTGAIAQLGFGTNKENSFYFNGFGSYMTANERLYAQVRAGYKNRKVAYGLEGIYSSELGSNDAVGMGLFMSGLQLGAGEVGMSIGYIDERGSTTYDSPYLAVEYSVPVRF